MPDGVVPAALLVFSHTTVTRVYREWCDKQKSSSERQFCGQHLVNEKGQRRIGRLVQAKRKTTQLFTAVVCRTEHKMRKALKGTCFSRVTCWAPVLSAKKSYETADLKEKFMSGF